MSIRENIILDTSQWMTATQKIRSESEKLAKDIAKPAERSSNRIVEGFKKIGRSAELFIAGMAAGALFKLTQLLRQVGSEARRTDAEFNKSFAIMGDLSEAQKNRMISAARETSRNMNIELDRVAQAYFYLTSAGLDAEQQIAALPVVAGFAKAGMFDMAQATDLLTDAQSALGLTIRDDVVANMENMNRVSDVLVKANTLANATVQQFSESLTNRAGAALRLVNKDIEEGVAVLAAMADQGVKGAEAGTRLDVVLRDLQRSALNSREEFAKMNIRVFDSEGRMRSLADILSDLENAMAGMSDEQKRATIMQLGFQERSVSALLSVLGLSESIRGYEKDLRDAAGTTQSVSENQLKSLEERAGLLKRAFADAFGPGMNSMLEAFIGRLEKIHGAIDRLLHRVSDSDDEMLFLLRRAGASPELIDEIEQRRAIRQAKELRDEMQKELGEIEIPVAVNLTEIDRKGLHRLLTGSDKGFRADITTVRADSLDSDRLGHNLRSMRARLESLHELIDDAESRGTEAGEIRARQHRQEARALTTMIEQVESYKAKLQELEMVNRTIADLQREKTETTQQETEAIIAATQAKAADIQMSHRAVEAVSILEKEIRSLADIKMGTLTREFEKYQNQVMLLNNELASGNITQREYEERLSRIGDSMKQRLTEIYNQIRNQLTPEQRRLWQSMINGIEKTNDALGETDANLRDIADAVSGVLTLADAFGAVDKNVRNVLRGTIEVLRNFENLRSADGLAAVAPALGIGAGIASIAVGIVSSLRSGMSSEEKRAQQREMQELQRSIQANVRALQRNTQALLNESVVAPGATRGQLDSIGQMMDELRRFAGAAFWSDVPGAEDLLTRFQESLSSAGIDLGVNLVDQFRKEMESGSGFAEALRNVLGLAMNSPFMPLKEEEGGLFEMLRRIIENFGEFGDSLSGIISRFQMSVQLGGVDIQQAIERFINDISGLDGVSEELRARLQKILTIDLSSEEGKKQLADIVASIFGDRADLIGDLSPDEFRELLEFIQRLGSDSAFSGGADDGFSRSAVIARTITDVQANEVVMLLEAIEYWTRQTAAALGNNTALSIPSGGFGVKAFEIPIPLPVEVMNFPDHKEYLNHITNIETHNTVNLGGVTIQAPPGSDPGGIDIDRLAEEFAWRIRKDVKNTAFQ